MTQNDLTALVAATVSTLAETNSGAPESTLYLLCGTDMRKWQLLRQVLVSADLVTIRANFVTLTDKGRELGARLNTAIQK